MSLTDLKKSKNTKRKKQTFTVDEFISDAENYAKGQPKIVSAQKKVKSPPKHRIKRHATFTLSESTIQQLTLLAQETNLAKSHIIRILINELFNEEKDKKIEKLLDSDVD